MLKRLEWNKKTASAFAAAAALIIVLVVALNPREITIAENTMLDPVEWDFQRPSQSIIINNTLKSTYSHGGLQATFHVWLTHYIEGVSDQLDHMIVALCIDATANNANGFVESVQVVVHKDQESKVDWLETSFKLENLSLTARAYGYSRSTQAYIKLTGVNHATSVHAKATSEWSLLTPNTQSHQLEIAYEITYYNGTAYNRVVQPFKLDIVGRGET